MWGTSVSAAVVSGIIHANGGPPIEVEDDEVRCHGRNYPIAHISPQELGLE